MPQPSRRAFLQVTAGGVAAAAAGLVVTTVARDASAAETDEIYRGHRIEIRPTSGQGHGVHAVASVVYLDGVELHVMKAPTSGYLSFMNHYRSYPTLRETARAAVDQLGTAKLLPLPRHR